MVAFGLDLENLGDGGNRGYRSADESSICLNTSGNIGVAQISNASAVRRLTPIECERLQGFPDDWTRIPWKGRPAEECPDGPRYKAIGNSMATPVMRWIGERIDEVERKFCQQ